MTDYVSDAQARSLILDVGRRLYHSGFVASNDGNITCKVGDNAIWATPTGVSKGFMTEEMLVKMDLLLVMKGLKLFPPIFMRMHGNECRQHSGKNGTT